MRFLNQNFISAVFALLPTLLTTFSSLVESASLQEKSENSSIKNVEISKNPHRTTRQDRPEITLISFLQKAVKKYGEKKVATSVHELAQHSMYDLIWLLAGELDTWLIYDLYKMYNTASADERVLSVYEKFRAGQVNRTIVPEVFSLDKKYNEYAWYKRVRTRLLENVDKYMEGSLKLGTNPPKIEYTPDGKPVIEGKPESVVAAFMASSTTTKASKTVEEESDEDEEPEDEDSYGLDFLESLI